MMIYNSNMKSKHLSLLFVVFIYVCAFGAGTAVLLLLPVSIHPLLSLFIADAAATVVVFIFNLMVKNASVYDPYWSVQPVFVIGAMYWHYGLPFELTHLLLLVPLACWSFRLTLNWSIGFENMQWEDWRYRRIKANNPRFAQAIVFTGIMMMPTCLVFLGTVPVWYMLHVQSLNPVLPAIGGLVILLGTAIEHRADSRLRRYKKDPNRGPYIDECLWRYSRHPNYLGEILIWVGVFIAGLVNFHLFNVAGIVLITALFVFISIPMMERHMLEKCPEYAVYQKIVPPLIFGPRKKIP